MVCIPCIVVPFLLFIWHRFLQPYVLKFWNPWKKVGNESTSSPILSCPMRAKKENVKKPCTRPTFRYFKPYQNQLVEYGINRYYHQKPDQNEPSHPEETALTNTPDKKND